jgi:hypothetical protein
MQITVSALSKTLALAGMLAAFAFVTSAPAAAKPDPTTTAVPLNQKDIHTAYNEGDFDKVLSLIDQFNKANKTYSRSDSIFVAKHLAVVYSANPQTREKGKYFMYRLLEMMPSAELVDMFVSDEIDRIFDKVRKEFLVRQKGFGVDSAQISMPAKASTTPVASNAASTQVSSTPSRGSQPFWKRNAFWIASGTGVAIAGAAVVFIYFQDEPAPGKTISIPSKTTE